MPLSHKYHAEIISGRGEGRRMGIPTLNFVPPPDFELDYGIYAGRIWLPEGPKPTVFHWGPIPAFGIKKSSLEGHLIDFSLENRPPAADFELIAYLRPVLNFPSSEALVEQIRKDVAEAKMKLHIV